MEEFKNLSEELKKFEESGNEEDIPATLDYFLKHVAKTGDTLYPWQKVKHLIHSKLALIMADFYDFYGGEELYDSPNIPPFSYVPTRNKILQHFDTFTEAPFTIQRLCEILIDPMKHYKRTDKFLRGLEKNVLVVSTVEPIRTKRKFDDENLINGLQDDNEEIPEKSSDSEAKLDDGRTANGVEDSSSNSSSPTHNDGEPLAKRRKLDVETEEASSIVGNKDSNLEVDDSSADKEDSLDPSSEIESNSTQESDQDSTPVETQVELKLQDSPPLNDESPDSAQDNTPTEPAKSEELSTSNSEAQPAQETRPNEPIEENNMPMESSEADSTSQPSVTNSSEATAPNVVEVTPQESACDKSTDKEDNEDTPVISTSAESTEAPPTEITSSQQ